MLLHNRKLNRWNKCNYSSQGYYFITVCTKDRIHYFGHVSKRRMIANKLGRIAADCLQNIPVHFIGVKVDECIVMPNHVHAIVIVSSDNVGNAYMRSLQIDNNRSNMLVSKIIQNYKAAVTRFIRVQHPHLQFAWQKSYYDHVIRSEQSLLKIRQYIRWNPLKWDIDPENISMS